MFKMKWTKGEFKTCKSKPASILPITDVMYRERNIEARSPAVLATEKQECYIFWVCVCSLSHPACKRAWHYIVTCGLSAPPILPHYLKKKRSDNRKENLPNLECVFWLSLQLFFSETYKGLSPCDFDLIPKMKAFASELFQRFFRR